MENESLDHQEDHFGSPDPVILEEDVDPDYEPVEEGMKFEFAIILKKLSSMLNFLVWILKKTKTFYT